jgi:hypothetical protein
VQHARAKLPETVEDRAGRVGGCKPPLAPDRSIGDRFIPRFSFTPLLLALVWLATACTSPHPPTEVKRIIEDTTAAAEDHLAAGDPHEASELSRAVLAVDPGFAPALAVRAALPPDLTEIHRSHALGANLARRVPVERSTTAKVLFYPLDRVLDILDIFTIDVHVGGGAFVNYHFTRALQAGIGLRATTGLGWHERRSLGSKSQAESGIVLVALGAEVSAATLAGTSGVYSSADSITGLHRPSSPSYQEYRDYWAIGESVTIAFLGIDWDLHPVQIADFFAGWVGVDFLRDDFARTRGLHLNGRERRWMANLYKLEREPGILGAYQELRETEAEEARLDEEAAEAESARLAEEVAAAEPAVAEAAEAESVADQLQTLKELHDDGLITDVEYQTRKREILGAL